MYINTKIDFATTHFQILNNQTNNTDM